MGDQYDVDELAGTTKVAKALGITRQRVLQLLRDDPTFPRPVTTIDRTHVFHLPDVLAWWERADIKARREKHTPRS